MNGCPGAQAEYLRCRTPRAPSMNLFRRGLPSAERPTARGSSERHATRYRASFLFSSCLKAVYGNVEGKASRSISADCAMSSSSMGRTEKPSSRTPFRCLGVSARSVTSGLSISRGSVIVVGRITCPAAVSCGVRKRSGIVYDVVAEQATCARGAVAHLGERFNGIEEVGGSSPPSSTTPTHSLPFPVQVSLTPKSRGRDLPNGLPQSLVISPQVW